MKHVFIALLALALVGTASAASFNITAKDALTNTTINATFSIQYDSYVSYQETANVSSGAVQFATGGYYIIQGSPYLYTNYTTALFSNDTYWAAIIGATGTTLTVNNSLKEWGCWNITAGTSQVRQFSTYGQATNLSCYNGTLWRDMYTSSIVATGAPSATGDVRSLTYDGSNATYASYVAGIFNNWTNTFGAGSQNSRLYEEKAFHQIQGTNETVTTAGVTSPPYGDYFRTANVTVTAAGYQSVTYTGVSTTTNLTANLTPQAISIRVYDESTNTLLNGTNVTLVFSTTDTENTTTSTNGTFTISRIPANNYTLKASATGYTQRSYIVELNTTASISMYLAANTTNVSFSIVDKDVTTIQIAGATVTMARLINNTWTTVSTVTADITGTAILSYVPLVRYRFTISADNYQSKVFYLDPVQFDSYTIQLQKSTTVDNRQDFSKVDVIITPTSFINGNTTVLLFTITSPTGTLTSYTVTATYPSSTNTSSGTQPQGETLSLGMSISGAASIDTVNLTFSYTTALGTKNFTRTYPIIDAPNTPNVEESGCTKYGMGDFECAGIATGATGLFSTLGFLYAGPVGGGAIALLFIGFFAKIGFLNQYAIIGSILVGFAILAWRSSE